MRGHEQILLTIQIIGTFYLPPAQILTPPKSDVLYNINEHKYLWSQQKSGAKVGVVLGNRFDLIQCFCLIYAHLQ